MLKNKDLLLEKIGIPLKKFIKEKYHSQKKAAQQLRISDSFLTHVIKCDRPAPESLRERLNKVGFDCSVFDFYYLKPELVKERYTFDEYLTLSRHYRNIINQLNGFIETQKRYLEIARVELFETKRELASTRKFIREHGETIAQPKSYLGAQL